MQTVLELLQKCEEFFAQKNVPNAKLDAQLLLAKALKCKRLELFLRFDDIVRESELTEFREDVKRRSKREPLQHIIGSVDFAGLKIKTDKRALIPRQETEELCEIIFERYLKNTQADFKILDLGTGSGAIILALKNFCPQAICTACDASEDALKLAKENANSLSLDINFVRSDWFLNVDGKFDLIVSNPPYLTEKEIETAQAEVKNFDPLSALQSPNNGLSDLFKIIEEAPNFLPSGGTLALEHGIEQAKELKNFAEKTEKYSSFETILDHSRRERFSILLRK